MNDHIDPQCRSNTSSLCFSFFFRNLFTPTSSSPTTYLTLIMGRHKWEMNNIYEHTTLAHNSGNGWERNTRHLGHFDFPGNLGPGQLNFTNIFENVDSRMLSILGMWQPSLSFHLEIHIWHLCRSARIEWMQCHRVTFCTVLLLLVLAFYLEWNSVWCSAHGVCLIWSCIPQHLVYSHAVLAFCFWCRTEC